MKRSPAELRAMHDLLVANLEAAGKSESHPKASCGWCSPDDTEVPVADKTYSEDELKAAVSAAVDSAVARIRAEKDEETSAAEQQARVDAAVASAVEPLSAKVTDLETALEAKTVEHAAEKAAREKIETDTAEAQRIAEEAAEVAARKGERTAKVREVAKNLAPKDLDDLVDKSGDRWAGMADADFDTLLDTFTAAAFTAPPSNRPPRTTTAMNAAEEGAGAEGDRKGPVLRELRDRRYSGSARVAG